MHLSVTDVENVKHPLELNEMRTPEGRDKSKAKLEVMQYEVDLSAAEVGATPVYWRPVNMVDEEGIDYRATDMPAYNLRQRGKKHCFFWGEYTYHELHVSMEWMLMYVLKRIQQASILSQIFRVLFTKIALPKLTLAPAKFLLGNISLSGLASLYL